MNRNERLKIALQKGGRLNEKSLTLLRQCGLQFNLNNSSLIASCINFPIDILLVRDDDIPSLVMEGVSDLGIVGENVLFEKLLSHQDPNSKISLPLGFCECRLSIAIPKGQPYCGLESLQNKRIATSYPNLLKNFLNKRNITATIKVISGSVELAPSIGLADAICDLVSTGKTLAQNNLVEIETVLKSEAVLIKSECDLPDNKRAMISELLCNIKSVSNKQILV